MNREPAGVAAILLLVFACSAAGTTLTEALTWIPAAIEEPTVAFTDWAAIKAEAGVPWLTGAASLDVKMPFLLRVDQDHAAASAFALFHFAAHAETWGFDTIDLEWEVQISGYGIPPTYLLKLREGLDLDAVLARFEERGFARTPAYGGVIYSRAINPSLDWVRTTELSIHNTGVLEAERLLILSSSYPIVELVLATHASELPGLAEVDTVSALAAILEDSLSALLMIGSSTCLHFSPNPLLELIGSPIDDSAFDALRAWLDSGDPLHAYEGLGVSYRHEDGRPVGTIAFTYSSTDDAKHDLDPRRLLAAGSASQLAEAPISEVLFTVEEASVEDAMIVMSVRPANDQPRRLFRMIWTADAPFAACR
jgi:hypothetical protein